MTQIFISYSRRDLAFVEQLAVDLQAAGLDVWYDLSGLKVGARWQKEITGAIRVSQYMIVVLSPESVVSKWVEREYLFANNLGIEIVPLYHRHCDLPLFFQNIHYVDVQEKNYERNFIKILHKLEMKHVEQKNPSISEDGISVEEKPVKRSWNWKNIIILLSLLILILVFSLSSYLGQLKKIPTSTSTLTIKPSATAITITAKPSSTPSPSTTPTKPVTPTPLLTEITDDFGVEMALIPFGSFTMGDNDSRQAMHDVVVSDFYIDKYEVTNGDYKKCVDDKSCDVPIQVYSSDRPEYYGNPNFDRYPVIFVTWDMANNFCKWRDARLPTEAEWEKAAQGTLHEKYPWGGDFNCNYANLADYCKSTDTTEVDSYEKGKTTNGIFNMSGNVAEWVNDYYSDDYYESLPKNSLDPQGPSIGVSRVLRGGSWWSKSIGFGTVFYRSRYEPSSRENYIGFRCARDATP